MNFSIIKRTAFSLIELSIVILVIGIMIAGAFSANSMIKSFRLSAARSLTNSSPVFGVKDLTLWYETTLEKSINFDSSGNVTRWNDINYQSIEKIHAVPYTWLTAVAAFTKYNENSNIGLPSMYFDGVSNHGFNIPYIPVRGINHTIFLVERHDDGALSGVHNGIVSQMSDAANFVIMYLNPGANSGANGIRYSPEPNKGYATNIGLNMSNKTVIHCFVFTSSSVAGRVRYYLNGNSTSISNNANNAVSGTNRHSDVRIGYKSRGQFKGDVFEFIVFSRGLKDEERKAVESYLKQKYYIK